MDSKEPKRIENALKSGQSVLVQVTKDPIGHKGARLTSQVSLPGRYLVYVPGNAMTGISRKLPDTERARLKRILKEVVPDDAGVIVRTAAEGASEAELRADVERLTATWERIEARAKAKSSTAPTLLHGEPDMTVRVIRDVFTEDFSRLIVSGDEAWTEVKRYIDDVAPDLADRVEKYTGTSDIFTVHRVSESIAKAMDRKVWLPSGGSLVIDRTEAMTVVDVNTGKFTGSGGNLEETVTKNNIEAAEEIVRQLRLRDIGGIIVIDFIDMVLESNRELVVRRLLECLGRDRTKHQVAEVTSLGLVQMTRKRVGSGLIEVFSETCEHCAGRGIIVQAEPTAKGDAGHAHDDDASSGGKRARGKGRGSASNGGGHGSGAGEPKNVLPPPNPKGPTPAQIAAAAHAAALHAADASAAEQPPAGGTVPDEVVEAVEAVLSGDRPGAADGPEAEAVAPRAQVEPEPAPESEPKPAPVLEPAPAPKRRRRGRVVAPAGPPTGPDEGGTGTGTSEGPTTA
jgi:ribonuclease E